MQQITSFTGLILTFAIAYGCDHWLAWLRKLTSATFDMASYLWQTSLINLLLAVPLLLLTIHMFTSGKQSKWVSVVFLVAGLLVNFAAALSATPTLFFLPPGYIEIFLPTSRVVFTGAFIAAIGFAGLVLPTKIKSE